MGPVAGWSLGIVGIDQVVNVITTRILTSAPSIAERTLHMNQFDVAGNATYQNAYTLYILPYSLIATSVATALFPQISQAIATRASTAPAQTCRARFAPSASSCASSRRHSL